MKAFLIRGWGLIFTVCGGTLTFSRGATPAARPVPPHWPRSGGGGYSANRIGARKTLHGKKFLTILYIRDLSVPKGLDHDLYNDRSNGDWICSMCLTFTVFIVVITDLLVLLLEVVDAFVLVGDGLLPLPYLLLVPLLPYR